MSTFLQDVSIAIWITTSVSKRFVILSSKLHKVNLSLMFCLNYVESKQTFSRSQFWRWSSASVRVSTKVSFHFLQLSEESHSTTIFIMN